MGQGYIKQGRIVIEVTILDRDPSYIMDLVRELRTLGYNQGKDFDFAYRPARWDNFSGDAVYNRSTVFSFYNEEVASWFSLKYTQ